METLSWSTIGEGGARGGKMAAAAAAALALVLVLVRVVVLVRCRLLLVFVLAPVLAPSNPSSPPRAR